MDVLMPLGPYEPLPSPADPRSETAAFVAQPFSALDVIWRGTAATPRALLPVALLVAAMALPVMLLWFCCCGLPGVLAGQLAIAEVFRALLDAFDGVPVFGTRRMDPFRRWRSYLPAGFILFIAVLLAGAPPVLAMLALKPFTSGAVHLIRLVLMFLYTPVVYAVLLAEFGWAEVQADGGQSIQMGFAIVRRNLGAVWTAAAVAIGLPAVGGVGVLALIVAGAHSVGADLAAALHKVGSGELAALAAALTVSAFTVTIWQWMILAAIYRSQFPAGGVNVLRAHRISQAADDDDAASRPLGVGRNRVNR